VDESLKSVLRWVGAAAAMLLVVFLTVPMAIDAASQSVRFGEEQQDPLEPITTDPDAGPLVAVGGGTAPAIGEVSVRSGEVRQADEEFVAIGGVQGDGLLFAFETFRGSPECVNGVVMRFVPQQVLPTSTLRFSNATVTDVPGLDDGDGLDEPLEREGSPVAEVELDDSMVGEEQRADLTEHYVAWVSGEAGDPDAPFAVVVRPDEHDSDRRIRFASTEAADGDSRPRLSWTGIEGCGQPVDPDEDGP
jgi:hypothetical protein